MTTSHDDLMIEAYRQHQAGDGGASRRCCLKVLESDPQRADAIYLLGVIAWESGQFDEACTRIRAAVEQAPENAVFVNALGELLLATGSQLEVRQYFERSIQLRPNYERAHNNLGRVCHAAGDSESAITHFSAAIRLNPGYATAHNNLGAVLTSQGNLIPAAQHYQEALRLQPEYPEARFNLAGLLQSRGELAAAIVQLKEAIRLRPAYARAHALLAQSLIDLGRIADSVEHLRTVVRLQPQNSKAHCRLADVLNLLGSTREAMVEYDEAVRLDPSDAESLTHRFRLKEQLCDWSDRPHTLQKLWDGVVRSIERGTTCAVIPFYAASLPWTASQQLTVARSYARGFRSLDDKPHGLRHPPRHDASDRLKIGYLSRDFYDHPVAHQCGALFGLQDRHRFEVHVYSFSPNDNSVYRRRIERDAEHFHDVESLSAPELVQKIRSDGIQILVDLMGYTGLARTSVVASRPAPIQVNWLGFPGTMGADFVDYMIADNVVIPPEQATSYSERIVRMPHTFMIADRDQSISEGIDSRDKCGLPHDAVVYCAFHNGYKIDPDSFRAWMHILRKVPKSVLWLSVRDPIGQSNLRREAEAEGVSASRLFFAPHVKSKAEHLARLGQADLFLDARYYNAHASACDALWSGLPVLTCPGETFASRVGASLLTAMGMTQLIAADHETYASMAIELGHSQPKRDELRQLIAAKRSTSPLFDTPLFVRNLENAFCEMWKERSSS